VSGGWVANDAVVPAHTLFLVGSGDPGEIGDRQKELAATITAAGGDVSSHEVSGADHIRILRDSDTIGSITKFLDPILDVDRKGPTPGMVDPRFKTGGLYLIVVLGLVALLGLAIGQTVPGPSADHRSTVSGLGFALPAGALILTMPLITVGGFDLLPLGAGQTIVMHMALTGALLWGARAMAQRGQIAGKVGALLAEGQWLPLRTVVWPGLAMGGTIVALLLPLSGVFHRMVPSPTRAVFWIVMTVACLPFFAAYEALTRRGPGGVATVMGIVAKIMLLVILFAGVGFGLLPFVISLIAILLILQYVLLEIFAGTAFIRGRNTALIAVTEATIVAFTVVTLSPVG
jgi:hypothetical protein